MTCKGKDAAMDSSGEVPYQSETFNGTVNMQMTDPSGMAMTMSAKMDGRYIGPCDQK